MKENKDTYTNNFPNLSSIELYYNPDLNTIKSFCKRQKQKCLISVLTKNDEDGIKKLRKLTL